MSRTKREKSGDTLCRYSWGGTPHLRGEDAGYKCAHVCRLEYKHDEPHYCCSTEDGETDV